MKKLVLTTRRKNSIGIIGMLLLANLLLYVVANNYFKAHPNNTQVKQTKEAVGMVETGWQVFNWGYSFMQYFKYEPTN